MKCPLCQGAMNRIKDKLREDSVDFTAYQCSKCGEELLTMGQLRTLAGKYRELRRSKETKIARWGNSLAVRIPQSLVEELGLHEGDAAVLKKSGGGFEVSTS